MSKVEKEGKNRGRFYCIKSTLDLYRAFSIVLACTRLRGLRDSRVGSAELRKREHENKTGETGES